MATSPPDHSIHYLMIQKPIEILKKNSCKKKRNEGKSHDESFELFHEFCENNLELNPENLKASISHEVSLMEIRRGSPEKPEEHKLEDNYKLDPTLQSEYEPNLKINDFSIDSPQDYIQEIYAANQIKSIDASKSRILDDISFSQSSHPKEERPLLNDRNSEMLQRSEIQVLQSKRAEALKKPMYFNIMIVGASSLGKTTFIDVFLSNKFEKLNKIRPPTTDILETTAKIKFENFQFFLKMIDTPGFTHNTNIRTYYKNLKKNIIERFSKFKKSQLKKDKKEYFQSHKEKTVKEAIDERIHLCLYFASAPRVNSNDLYLLKKLQKYCSVIPIIAKGDCYTPEEIKEIKIEFLKATRDQGIDFFDCASALDNPEKMKLLTDGPFGPCPPFLIISSLEKIELEPNKFAYCRKYNWGICNIENPLHCDFSLMYKLLIGYFSLELINLTDFFYKAYLNHKQEKKKKLKEDQQKYKIGFGIMTFILGAIYFKKNLN